MMGGEDGKSAGRAGGRPDRLFTLRGWGWGAERAQTAPGGSGGVGEEGALGSRPQEQIRWQGNQNKRQAAQVALQKATA